MWKIDERLKITGDAAWLIPFSSLTASDAHLLRIGTDFNGPTPIDGHGYGVQLEAILSYNVTDAFSVGLGARYWRIQTQNADATSHFRIRHSTGVSTGHNGQDGTLSRLCTGKLQFCRFARALTPTTAIKRVPLSQHQHQISSLASGIRECPLDGADDVAMVCGVASARMPSLESVKELLHAERGDRDNDQDQGR